jgi:uroporphyrinogen-III synthase
MKTALKLSAKVPLSKTRILVGRARHQASALSSELRRKGAEVIEIPFIEIRKPKSFKPFDAALKNLASYDWLILTSVNGVEAMWERMVKLKLIKREGHESREEPSMREARGIQKAHDTRQGHDTGQGHNREGHDFSRAVKLAKTGPALAAEGLRIAAIGPATKNALEQRGFKVHVVPKEYVAESVVRSLRRRVKDKRVLLVRAKVARDVIPRELRRAGAQVEVVEAYETVVPKSSRRKLQAALKNPRRRPQVITFTSSSTVRNFVALLGGSGAGLRMLHASIVMASIGPVTSATLREMGLRVDVSAREFTIPGLVAAIVRWAAATRTQQLKGK